MFNELILSISAGTLAWFMIWIGNDHTIISTISIAVLSLILLSLRKQKSDIFLFTGFALLATIAEAFITKTGAWYYSYPLFFGLPGWLPFAWGISVTIVHDIYHTLRKHCRHEQKKLFLWTETLLYILCIYISMTYFQSPVLLIILTSIILLTNIKLHHPKEELFFVFYFCIVGCLAEAIGISLGIWSYTSKTYILQIIWMSLMYAQFALIARRVSLSIERYI